MSALSAMFRVWESKGPEIGVKSRAGPGNWRENVGPDPGIVRENLELVGSWMALTFSLPKSGCGENGVNFGRT